MIENGQTTASLEPCDEPRARCRASWPRRALRLPCATPAPAGPSDGRRAADIAPLPAVQADSLVDSYGVGIHLAFLDTPYDDATAVADALSDLGVRHVRDDLLHEQPAAVRRHQDRRRQGHQVQPDHGQPASPDSAAAYVNTVATQLPPGSVESVEGSNEWDLFSGGSRPVAGRADDPAARALPGGQGQPGDRGPARCWRRRWPSSGTTSPLGDLSPYADSPTAHMYPGGYRPSNEISQITAAIRGSIPPPSR